MIIGGEKGDRTVDKDDKTTWEILDQEIDKLIKYSERQTDKMLNTIKLGMICITLLIVVWIVLYMVIKGFQMQEVINMWEWLKKFLYPFGFVINKIINSSRGKKK